MAYPEMRMRRLRNNPVLRDMVRETKIGMDDLIYPMFVHYGENIKNEIASMPGQYQWSIDNLVPEVKRLSTLGVKAIILFGIPENKDEFGSDAYAEDGIVQKAIKAIKKSGSEMYVIGDVCLCEYTSHGHCGMLHGEKILNDATLPLLAKTAVAQAEAGVDMVAPSDMMDGRVEIIREALDHHGFDDVPIMSYAAKYASAYYGPFRQAADSAPAFGDRRSHQMDPANVEEALREVELDIDEGADIVMVKPAQAYMDVIWRVKDSYTMPVAAYAVSGEYSMIEAAAQNGWIDRDRVMYESLLGLKRAGADIILSYHTPMVAELISKGQWPPQ